VPLLLLKLIVTPLIVGGASYAARRWGPAVGGWLVALPLTSAPVLFFLAVEQGTAFASEAAIGTLVGLGILGGWSLGYVAARRAGAVVAVLVAAGAYGALGLAVQPMLGAPFPLLAGAALGSIAVATRVLPDGRGRRSDLPHPPWDLPARVIVGTALVVGLTTIAPLLGPSLSGLLATYPVYVSVLAVFTQLREGPEAAVEVIRGMLAGLFGTIAFYIVLHPLLVPAGIAAAFGAAIAATFAIQAVALRRVRARR
jgi:hypothetical protein